LTFYLIIIFGMFEYSEMKCQHAFKFDRNLVLKENKVMKK